jgi:hypothetical protein
MLTLTRDEENRRMKKQNYINSRRPSMDLLPLGKVSSDSRWQKRRWTRGALLVSSLVSSVSQIFPLRAQF